jgi:hypothetical protein
MPIEINRTEVLSLMQELPANHFLQSRLVDELIVLNNQIDSAARVAKATTHVLEVKSAASRPGTREVINGKLAVLKPNLGENQFTDEQLNEMYEAGGIATKKQCKWQTYGYQCRKTSKNEFCDEHMKEMCAHRDEAGVVCGNKADHGCPTELQFVCGAPCCAAHSNCGNHNYRRPGGW